MKNYSKNWREERLAPRRKRGRGYSFRLSAEMLADAANLSAEGKLVWLRQANTFVNEFVSQRKLEIWDKYKREVKG